MNCRDVEALWADWLGGELDAAQAGRLEAHLSECPTCRQEAEALQRTVRLVRSLETEPAAEGASVVRRGHAAGLVRMAAAILLAFAVGFAARGLIGGKPGPPPSQAGPPDKVLREYLTGRYAAGEQVSLGQLLAALSPES
jgi:anti-sigma factor RsiW